MLSFVYSWSNVTRGNGWFRLIGTRFVISALYHFSLTGRICTFISLSYDYYRSYSITTIGTTLHQPLEYDAGRW